MIIWNFKTGETLHRLLIQDAEHIRVLALAPGGEFLLSGCQDTLKLWKLRNGEYIEEFQFDQGVEAIACGSNGIVYVGLRGGRVCFLRFNNLSLDSGQLRQ